MFKTISNAWKMPEVRKKMLYTLLLIIVFRFGSHISVPMINFQILSQVMQSDNQGLLGLVNLITGGAFSRLSIFAMSISPYISASIIVQLLGMIFPNLEMLIKEGGEYGRRQISKITKGITLFLALVQSTGLYIAYSSRGIFVERSFLVGTIVVLSFLAGTSFLVWLGDKITNKGIGNGISMLIFAGIVASVPANIQNMIIGIISSGTINVQVLILAIGSVIASIVLIAAVVFVQSGERRIPIQYAKKVVGRKMYGGQNTHIPLKLAMAGVMPIIFASSFISFPAILIQLFAGDKIGTNSFLGGLYNFSVATTIQNVSWPILILHAVVYLVLIVLFTFFYTFATFNPVEVATNLKQNGGFIPGIRAGKATSDYLTGITVKLTWFGAVFLSLVAIIPMLTRNVTFGIAFAGTSILIIVGVALETVKQLESQMVMKHYKGFLN